MALQPAHAAGMQSLTLFARYDAQHLGGNLQSCLITFSSVFSDESLPGRVFFVNGSIGYVFDEGRTRLSPLTKIGVSEKVDRNGEASAEPVPISSAYILSKTGFSTDSLAGHYIESDESPKAKLKVFKNHPDRRDFFSEIIGSGEINVEFKFADLGNTYRVPVDLRSEAVKDGQEVRSGSAMDNFRKCSSTMPRRPKSMKGKN